MSKIKTNERELASNVAHWFNEHIERNDFPFTSATNETGIATGETTRFGDIVIWRDRNAGSAYSYIELKPPTGSKENLETFRQKAIALNVTYAYTWNFQSLNVYKVEKGKITLLDSHSTPIFLSIEESKQGDKQAIIRTHIMRICADLVSLHETGKQIQFQPEKVYFIHLIRNVVQQLIPMFEKFIRDNNKGPFKAKINKYVIEQGISYPSDEEFYKIIARQRVYGLVTKIIFYLTIRRHFKDLPDFTEDDSPDLNLSVKRAFSEAAKKDWQAVFVDDPIEELGFPEHASHYLKAFFSELRVYHFGELKEDVIAELFEEIIDPVDRHALGQYFTREDLVDFTIAMTVNDADGIYSDPTCGSGTFLIRLYDRLKYLSGFRKQHAALLNQIWGIDIGKFPAELSTINLFRQQARDFENFPRVLHKSIFDIHQSFVTEFPPPNAGSNYKKVQITLPLFDGFVGNFPFIRQELIEKKDKGFKNQLTKLLATEYLFTYPKLFDLKKGLTDTVQELKNKSQERISKAIEEMVDKGQLSLKLSGQADIYTYIFIHTATLLAENGSFAIITSNSWLDTAYGSVLKEFFLDHFKIKCIVASWAEPWFEEASVNTIITVLEKESDAKARAEQIVKFVKLKKKLVDLIPYRDLQLQSIKRWQCIDGIVRTIENAEYQSKTKKNHATHFFIGNCGNESAHGAANWITDRARSAA